MKVNPISAINDHDKREIQNLLEWRKRKKEEKKKTQNEDFAAILKKTLKK